MKPLVNTSALSLSSADSGSLALLNSVLHRVTEPGVYQGTVTKNEEEVGKFTFRVPDDAGAAGSEEPVAQRLSLDLKEYDSRQAGTAAAAPRLKTPLVLAKGGFLLIHTSSANMGYALGISLLGKDRKNTRVFDSQKLSGNDLFITSLPVPGRYLVKNTETPAQAELAVAWPVPGKIMRKPDPVVIESSTNGLVCPKEPVQLNQSLIFNCSVPSRIVITLVAAESKPAAAPAVKSPAQTAGGPEPESTGSGVRKKRTIRFYKKINP